MSVIELESARYLEFSPTYWMPTSGDEKLAALCGYLTCGGVIAKRSQKYTKKNCDASVCASEFVGAFYGNRKDDLEKISSDMLSLGMRHSKIGVKKTLDGHIANGFQMQISESACQMFVDAGAPFGKKTTAEFGAPEWVANGSDGVKRAYLSALFGAEGFTPALDESTKSRHPIRIELVMCKIKPASGRPYFDQLAKMIGDLGVKSSVSEKPMPELGKSHVDLKISVPAEFTLSFIENIGFSYCKYKSIMAWKLSKYIRACNYEADRRRVALEMREGGDSLASIGDELVATRGDAHRLLADIRSGKRVGAGNKFPNFNEWIEERWDSELCLLRLNVASKKNREKKESVFNVLVSSPDHSYLLANGANNYNSFETMSGRVYYPFDRKVHVGDYKFNPQLQIYIGQDFNIDPMSSVVFQIQPNGEVWIVDEIILFNSNTEETCDEIEKRYWRNINQITIYPDPAGKARQHARGETDLDIFREKGLKRLKFHRKHPAVSDRVNAVNRMLRNADGDIRLRINETCKNCIESFEQTIYKEGSRDVDKSLSVEHATDAAGYFLEFEFPVRKLEVAGISI